jgi:hypothetical protein
MFMLMAYGGSGLGNFQTSVIVKNFNYKEQFDFVSGFHEGVAAVRIGGG